MAEPEKKISKQKARYQDYPKATQWCSRCSMWREPSSCTLVAGYIEARGWCEHWEKK